MGLFDIFKKPDWKHDDVRIRERAVKNLTDEKILRKIVRNKKEHGSIRLLALRNLDKNKPENQKLIRNLTKDYMYSETYYDKADGKQHNDFWWYSENQDLRKAAVEYITDQEFLYDLSINSENRGVRETAASRLTDPNLLYDFSKSSSGNMRDIIPNITDENLLIVIATTNENELVRVEAIKKLSNKENYLKYLKHESNRVEIIKCIDDEKVLSKYQNEIYNEIIRQYEHNTDYQGISSNLLYKLKDENLLYDLVLRFGNRNSDNARIISKYACNNISDEKLLANLAIKFNDKITIERHVGGRRSGRGLSRHVRYREFHPISRISNKSILEDIVLNGGEIAKKQAKEKLERLNDDINVMDSNPQTNKKKSEISKTEKFDNKSSSLINKKKVKVKNMDYKSQRENKNLKVDDETYSNLMFVINNTDDENLISEAIEQFDMETIIDIARHDPNWKVRGIAIEHIYDEDTLRNIRANDADGYIKSKIGFRLKELGYE